jgi:hypothetical protein
MEKSTFPCWLKGKDIFIGRSLIEYGYGYDGSDDEVIVCDGDKGTGYIVDRCCRWTIAAPYGDVFLEVRRDGAVFSKCLENDQTVFESEIAEVKKRIRKASRKWSAQQPQGKQLKLALF